MAKRSPSKPKPEEVIEVVAIKEESPRKKPSISSLSSSSTSSSSFSSIVSNEPKRKEAEEEPVPTPPSPAPRIHMEAVYSKVEKKNRIERRDSPSSESSEEEPESVVERIPEVSVQVEKEESSSSSGSDKEEPEEQMQKESGNQSTSALVRISAYPCPEIRPVQRKSPNILSKIKMFDESRFLMNKPQKQQQLHVDNIINTTPRSKSDSKISTLLHSFESKQINSQTHFDIAHEDIRKNQDEAVKKLSNEIKPKDFKFCHSSDVNKTSLSPSDNKVPVDDSSRAEAKTNPFVPLPKKRATLEDPSTKLLDENTNSFDPANRDIQLKQFSTEIHSNNSEFLRKSGMRKGVFFSSHSFYGDQPIENVSPKAVEADRLNLTETNQYDTSSSQFDPTIWDIQLKLSSELHSNNSEFLSKSGMQKSVLFSSHSFYDDHPFENIPPEAADADRLNSAEMTQNATKIDDVILPNRSSFADENEGWNRFLRDVARLSVEIDDDELETFL